MLTWTAFLVSLAASAVGGSYVAGAGEICAASGGESPLCVAPLGAGSPSPLVERSVYATPAEVDCRAAIATVAVNSRADLQLESGDCSPMTADYRFHVSRVPDAAPSGPVAAPQRIRKNARAATNPPACRGIPDPNPPALITLVVQPLALVATPDLMDPASAPRADTEPPIRIGRGFDPPEAPPIIVA